MRGGNEVIEEEVPTHVFDPFGILEGGGGGGPGGGAGSGPVVSPAALLRGATAWIASALGLSETGIETPKGSTSHPNQTPDGTVPMKTTDTFSTASTAAIDAARENGRVVMFHYTSDAGLAGILASQTLLPSTKAENPKDARYGNGQYVSDILPGTRSNGQLAYTFVNDGRRGSKYRNFVAIDVTGLQIVQGRSHVYVIPNNGPLPISGRIVAAGLNQPE